jgi:hypothetical protein
VIVDSTRRRVARPYVTVGKENAADIELYYQDWVCSTQKKQVNQGLLGFFKV